MMHALKFSDNFIERVKMQRKQNNKLRKENKKTKDGKVPNEASILNAVKRQKIGIQSFRC